MTTVAFYPGGNPRLARCWIDVQDHCHRSVFATVDRHGIVRHLCYVHFAIWREEVRQLGGKVVELGLWSPSMLKEIKPDLYEALLEYHRRWQFNIDPIIEGIVADVQTLAVEVPDRA